jgi:hypothetical protein
MRTIASSIRSQGDRLLAIAFVLMVTVALAGITTGDTGASFTTSSTNPNNHIGANTLAAPTSLSAPIASNGGTVDLSWTATTSTWATGTRIYRATVSGGPYSLLQTITGLATTTWSEAPGNSIYYYVARAYYTTGGANWESANSNEVTAKPLHHFSFATVATEHSAVAFNVTMTAQASDNSTVTGFTGTVALTVNPGTIAPTTSAAFSAGVRTESVTITGPYTTGQTVTATGGTPSRTGTSNAFTLNHFHATAIAINNKAGGVAGKPENGDTVVITFSEAATTTSIGSCDGAANSGTDLLTNDAMPDTMTANGLKLAFGSIALGNNGYFTADKNAKNSTCAWSAGNTVYTITLQSLASIGTVAGASTATYTPNAAITSATGEAIDTAQTPSVTAVLF